MSDPYARIAFDFTLMRPGCVLLQAAMGGYTNEGKNTAHDFPTDSWLLAPTKDLKIYEIPTEEQYQNIVANYEDMRAYAASKSKKQDITRHRVQVPTTDR